jgi:hypothetical protein
VNKLRLKEAQSDADILIVMCFGFIVSVRVFGE